jgi:hypothetical protein
MDAVALGEDDLDFDLGYPDGLQCFDLDLLHLLKFCGLGDGDESFLLAVTDKEGDLGLDLGSSGDDGDGARESSPDSILMDEGAPPSKSARDCDGGKMSAYMSELDRFLMDDDEDEEAGRLFVAKELAPDKYLFDDLVVFSLHSVHPATRMTLMTTETAT